MNAKKELNLQLNNPKSIICASILYSPYNGESTIITLPLEFGNFSWNEFVNAMDFEYDAGYGLQELFGTIWYNDGSWSERSEYDGSECWVHKECPAIPDECISE